MNTEHTFKLLTPAGIGGISVFDLNGSKCLALLSTALKPKPTPQANALSVHQFVDDTTVLDEILLAQHKSRENQHYLRLNCHGGEAVRQAIKSSLSKLGFVPAMPTDQVESYSKQAQILLAEASTRHGALSLLAQTAGLNEQWLNTFSSQLATIKQPQQWQQLHQQWTQYTKRSQTLLNLLYPVQLVLAGSPNSGKSSLFNALLDANRTVTSTQAGTTIDTITATLSLSQFPIILSDTPGLREDSGHIESMGIEIGKKHLQKADFILYLVDSQNGISPTDRQIIETLDSNKLLLIYSKSDLGTVPNDQIGISIFNTRQLELLKLALYSKISRGVETPIESAALFTVEDVNSAIKIDKLLHNGVNLYGKIYEHIHNLMRVSS